MLQPSGSLPRRTRQRVSMYLRTLFEAAETEHRTIAQDFRISSKKLRQSNWRIDDCKVKLQRVAYRCKKHIFLSRYFSGTDENDGLAWEHTIFETSFSRTRVPYANPQRRSLNTNLSRRSCDRSDPADSIALQRTRTLGHEVERPIPSTSVVSPHLVTKGTVK